MKKFRIQLIIWALVTVTSLQAQNGASDVIYIKGAKFTAPLVQKWIAEYAKVNPKVQVKWTDKEVDGEDIDLNLLAYNDSLQLDKRVVYVGRYALLPVTSKDNSYLSELNKKNLTKKKLKDLFFNEDVYADEEKDSKSSYKTTVYSGNNRSAVTVTFASYFGHKTADIRGKRISGDDLYLINAIEKDPTGITFNNLSYIFNTETRQLKDNIALLPLDVKKEQRKVLSSANIDQVIALLESQSVDLIPVQNFGFFYSNTIGSGATDFLSWILNKGLEYNHNYGFLKPSEDVLASQKQQIGSEKYLSSANTK